MASLVWTQRQHLGPKARMLHALAYDEARKRTLLFGGWLALQAPAPQTWLGAGTVG